MIKVDFPTLVSASESIKSASAQAEGMLEELKSKIRPVVESWTGETRDLYNEKQQRWDQAFDDLKIVLAKIGTALATAAQDYQDGERSNAARF